MERLHGWRLVDQVVEDHFARNMLLRGLTGNGGESVDVAGIGCSVYDEAGS